MDDMRSRKGGGEGPIRTTGSKTRSRSHLDPHLGNDLLSGLAVGDGDKDDLQVGRINTVTKGSV
jgi:hypothetical protein